MAINAPSDLRSALLGFQVFVESEPDQGGQGSGEAGAAVLGAGFGSILKPRGGTEGMSHAHLTEALRQYPTILKEFLQAIPPERLHHRQGPGFWTVYEHLEHLVQTQEVIFRRLELVRDQEKPQIVPFDPDEHHRETAASPQAPSAAQLVEQYARWREKQLQLIAKASPELWAKAADHPEYDRYGFEILVRHALLHDGFHMSRIEELGFMKKEVLQPM
jgi:uncharacterized damage-inducible protein DinB